MTNDEKELLRRQLADFRLSVVAELCNPYLSDKERTVLIQQKATRDYVIPGSTKHQISAATIRNWIRLYKQFGKEGLYPKLREDRGRPRSISDKDGQMLIDLLEKKPELTVAQAIRVLQNQGKLQKNISSSSASRFTKANNLDKKTRRRHKLNCEDYQLRFSFESPLACVQVDAMHAFAVPDANGKKRKAILIAFLDDFSRRILTASFDFSENSLLFEDGIKHILKSHGLPGKIYTDNGSTFISNQTKRIVESLGVYLVHSKPYRPQGRGKIERFFRTVREQFIRPLDPDEIKSLEQLNHLFRTWLDLEYHRNKHSSIGTTPIEAWLSKTNTIKHVDPHIDLDRAFFHHATRKVYQDSIISLHGTAYEVPPILTGKKVDVYYDPHPPIQSIQIKEGNKDYGQAKPVKVFENAKVKRNVDHNKELEIFEKQEASQCFVGAINKGGTL